MENQQPDALQLAEGGIEMNLDEAEKLSADMRTAHLIKTLNDRVQKLEAMLEAVGAGGVSAQRVTQAADHIEQDRKMAAAQVVLPEPDGWRYPAPNSDFHYYEERRDFPVECKHLNYEPLYTERQVRELLAKATCTKSQTQEPFGYFKAEPFGWRDCAETDEGAIALYEAPQPQADARDAERVYALYTALEVCSAELFAQCAHQGRAMKYVEQARKALAAEQCSRAAIAKATGPRW